MKSETLKCPACGKPPEIILKSTAPKLQFALFHQCEELPRFYFELSDEYTTEAAALEDWEFVCKRILNQNPFMNTENIQVLGNRALVKPIEAAKPQNQTIVIPETVQKEKGLGEYTIVKLGKHEKMDAALQVGQTVFVDERMGSQKVGDDGLKIVSTLDIVAIRE